MKYLHRNKMKNFYSDYSQNNTTPSKGQNHNHHHIRIMNEDVDNGNTELTSFNFVSSLIEDVANLYDKKKDADMRNDMMNDGSETREEKSEEKQEEIPETPKKQKDISNKSNSSPKKPLSSRKALIAFLKKQGVETIFNPKTKRTVKTNNKNITEDYLRKYVESNFQKKLNVN